MKAWFQRGAVIFLVLLILLGIAWESRIAPLRPGGSWAILKVLPLLAPLFGLLHGRRYTAQWCSMLSLAYFCEGVVRVWSERGPGRPAAAVETLLAAGLFACCIGFARLAAPERLPQAAPPRPG